MICFAKPVLTEDLYIVQKEELSIACYQVFRVQADWTLTHMSHKDTEQSTIEASVTLDGITLTD
jgi:hypothetical protein